MRSLKLLRDDIENLNGPRRLGGGGCLGPFVSLNPFVRSLFCLRRSCPNEIAYSFTLPDPPAAPLLEPPLASFVADIVETGAELVFERVSDHLAIARITRLMIKITAVSPGLLCSRLPVISFFISFLMFFCPSTRIVSSQELSKQSTTKCNYFTCYEHFVRVYS